MLKKFRSVVALALGGSLAAVSSFAQTTTTGQAALDPTGAVATITNQLTSISSIGTAILGVVTVIAAIAWLRRPIH